MDEPRHPISERTAQEITERAAELAKKRAAEEVFRRMEIDPDDVNSMRSFREDMSFLRRMRMNSDQQRSTASKTMIATIGTIVGSMFGALMAWLLGHR